MSDDEVEAFLRESRKFQLGTINADGTPHMVTMFYGLTEDRLTFWTYGKAQKTRNLARDPRVSCLVEAGDDYAELRGVLLYGTTRLVTEPEAVLDIGMDITKRMTGLTDADVTAELRGYVEHTGRKRVAYIVEPTRVVSWDHRKLSTPATA